MNTKTPDFLKVAMLSILSAIFALMPILLSLHSLSGLTMTLLAALLASKALSEGQFPLPVLRLSILTAQIVFSVVVVVIYNPYNPSDYEIFVWIGSGISFFLLTVGLIVIAIEAKQKPKILFKDRQN